MLDKCRSSSIKEAFVERDIKYISITWSLEFL